MDKLQLPTILAYLLMLCIPLWMSDSRIQKIVKPREEIRNRMIATILYSLILSIIYTYLDYSFIHVIISFIGIVLLCKYNFIVSFLQSCFYSCFYLFHMLFLYLMNHLLMSILKVYITLTPSWITFLCVLMSNVMFILILYVYHWRINRKKMKSLMVCEKQLSMVNGGLFTLILALSVATLTYTNTLKNHFITIFCLLTILFLYLIIFQNGLTISDLIQYQFREKQQSNTINYQLRQQNSLLKITEVLNLFKHDYREHILSIEYLMEHDYKQEALMELKKDCLCQLDALPSIKKFANNPVLNSLFIDLEEICDEKKIVTDILFYYPQHLSICDNDCHELFRILMENAIEANEKVSKEKRYINVKSRLEGQWLRILIENPYEEELIFKNNKPIAMTQSSYHQGLGLLYVEQLLDEVGGIIRFEEDQTRQRFRAIVLLRIEELK